MFGLHTMMLVAVFKTQDDQVINVHLYNILSRLLSVEELD